MSEHSSDSESSCDWTIISHEGSEIETLGSENGVTDNDQQPNSEEACVQEQLNSPLDLNAEGSEKVTESTLEATQELVSSEDIHSVTVVSNKKLDESNNATGANSDDSDIITLDSPLVEEVGVEEEVDVVAEEDKNSEELYLGLSSSSQYTFTPPETETLLELLWKVRERVKGWGNLLNEHLFGSVTDPGTPLACVEESSSDETSDQFSHTLRRRRVRKRTLSSSETEERPPAEQVQQRQHQRNPQFGSTLNKCILLALVIAISMGFGHFYGTTQIQERQMLVEKIHEIELNGVKDDLYQCQKEQEFIVDKKEAVGQLAEDLQEKQDMVLSLTGLMDKISKENQQLRLTHAELQSQKEELATRLKQTEVEKITFESQQQTFAEENQRLRDSLEHEEQALSLLQEELRKLREQIRNLEDKGAGTESIITENQKLKDQVEEEKQRIRNFLNQKKALVAEAQMLRQELDKERKVTEALQEELDQVRLNQFSKNTEDTEDDLANNLETEDLQARLIELEKKLNFEQQRSDLWERLYIETKEEGDRNDVEKTKKSRGKYSKESKEENKKDDQGRKKSKDTFFGSVKETFDAMKNSTKEFVRHHKEKIKQAKEAVKENLKKFSDSVKTTFRHLKDSTKNMFDKNNGKKRNEKNGKPAQHDEHPFKSKYKQSHDRHKDSQHFRPYEERFKDARKHESVNSETTEKDEHQWKCSHGNECNKDQRNKSHRSKDKFPKGCSSVFECAHLESMNLFNKALDPVTADEFHQLMHSYLKQEVDNFHHWRELEKFINKFFHNGVFRHDQLLFTDFVNDVEDYLEDMVEYQKANNEVFEDLDEYVYRHFFGDTYSKKYGPSRRYKRPSDIKRDDPRCQRHKRKYHQQRPQNQKEDQWNKAGCTSGRHMANVEIELEQMPFDPKY
ncbi:cell cycle progression protein 1 isoform X1 [Latimeria chalumnae]|uniref:cell cycle progression protein 1 isoform X1 n=1 Tax=Latimeria chalumnae TaxID=7897 RepID=UPI0003C0FCE8|nr:PREDICTED: cell cycle progression protein 1 isoform X2 [Latimeria chalumnae]|eukprot:XP_014343955.1 PREDICTED: cell cycle progression protein 1 isoform X2 [Latimeria chalumnae]